MIDYIYLIKFIGVAISVALADVCWVKYFHGVEDGNPLKAGLWAVGLIVLGALSIEGYVSDSSLIIAAGIGAFIGTYITVAHKNHVKINKEKKNK
jgi:hypothetical protein